MAAGSGGSASVHAGVVGWVDLQADDVGVRLARAASHPKLVGVRHIVQSEPDDRFLLRPAFGRGIASLRQFDLTYDILIYPRHLAVASEFVGAGFRSRLSSSIIWRSRRSGPGRSIEWARDLRVLAAAPNVWCKLSGLVTEADWERWRPEDIQPYLDVAFDCFGADRLVAGSDWPVCTVAGSIIRVRWRWCATISTRRPAAERDAVLGGNAQRIWRLSGVRAA